jgi:lipopolysaccharide transport system permease protein
MFLDNANLLKKLSFPRLCLPVTTVATACVNFGIVFGIFTIFLVLTGYFPGIAFVALVPVLAIHIALAVGLGVGLGLLNVFFRDVGQLFGIILQFWFWLTPIVYPPGILPQRLARYMDLNPMARVIGACQDILVHARWPDWGRLAPVLLLAVLLCALGLRLFRRHSGELVDEL